MNEEARTKSAFSTVEACRSVFKLDYPQLTKIARNVEAFDECGKITHGTGLRAELRDSCTAFARVETSKARVPRYEPQKRAYRDTNELPRGRTNTR